LLGRLRVLLEGYDCGQCHEEEDAVWHGRNTALTEKAIVDFFYVIYDLETKAIYNGAALANVILEISIHSPSDEMHYFKSYDFNVTSDAKTDQFAALFNGLNPVPTPPPHNPPQVVPHADTPHRELEPGEIGPIRRLFGRSAMDVRFAVPLAPLNCITRFVVRRQTRRRLNAIGMCRILAALPDLQAVDVELWREWTALEQQMADQGKYLIHFSHPRRRRHMGKLLASC
jgi:hypothetical protein